MAVNLSPVGGVAAQFFTNNGVPLAGGKIFTYAAGTTTPQVTYTSSQGNVAWTNPIVLDAAGRVPGSGEIWLTDGLIYKFVLKDSNDVLIATYDNISGINSNAVAYTNQQEIVAATAGQTVFNLNISYQPGTNSLSVFVDGVNQYGPGAQYAYVETDQNTVTFNTGLHVGAEVKFTTTQQQAAGAVDASQVTYDPPFTGSVATNVEAALSAFVSVSDFDPDPTGILDSSTEFTSAVNAAQVSGVTVTVPNGTYKILDAGGFPSQNNAITPVNILAGADVQFTGTVVGGDDDSVPCFGHSKTNWYNLMNYNYMYSEPGYAWEDPNIPGQYPFGSMTLIVECIPQTTFQGNADACFFGFRGKAGGNFAGGAVNFLSELESGFLGNANVSEFDINNFAADGKGLGITIIGIGTHKPEVAQKIARIEYGNQSPTGSGGNWIPPYQYGIQIYNAENGLYIDQQQVQSPQAAIGVNPGPQATPTQYAFYINDPGSNRKFGVQNNGYIKPRDEAPFSVFGTNVVPQATSGQNPSMYLMPDGWVRLAGQILADVGTTVAPGATLITLNAGFRPNRTVYLPIVNSAGTLGSVTITSGGVITSSITLTDATYLALDAVSFKLSN